MKEEILDILLRYIGNPYKAISARDEIMAKMPSECRYTEKDVDMAYIIGAFNSAKIDGLADELSRLRKLQKQPHDIVDEIRNRMNGQSND